MVPSLPPHHPHSSPRLETHLLHSPRISALHARSVDPNSSSEIIELSSDFCYFVNLSVLLQALFFKSSVIWFKVTLTSVSAPASLSPAGKLHSQPGPCSRGHHRLEELPRVPQPGQAHLFLPSHTPGDHRDPAQVEHEHHQPYLLRAPHSALRTLHDLVAGLLDRH